MTTVTLFRRNEFTDGQPSADNMTGFDAVRVTYSDGTTTLIFYPRDMTVRDFAETATWLKVRVGVRAHITGVEFDR